MKKNKSKSNLIKKFYIILLLPAAILISYISSFAPSLVEQVYSNGIYKLLSQPISRITGVFPFSVAEVVVIALVMFSIWKLLAMLLKMLKQKHGRRHTLFNFFINTLMLVSIIYFCFIGLWGLNYHREPFSQIAGLDIQPASIGELVIVCEDISQRTNELRTKVSEDHKGNMYLLGGYREMFNQAAMGYDEASGIYPQLGGKYGPPKPVTLSKAMSFTGIWGVFFPLTEEANVNIAIPDSMKPSTACHEMAHQRGFAREDEANYIASVACGMHPSVEFQYSGALSSLVNTMNAVYKHDRSEYKRLYSKFSIGVQRDWTEIDEFNQASEGVVGEISNKVNDTYLKANMQEDGVYSYGRMVDLIIAEYRKNGKL